MITIFSATIIKLFIILVYFLTFSMLRNIYRYFCFSIKNTVCNQFKTIISDICHFLCRVIKKLYTYNFYSFNKSEKLYGGITIFIFFIFIISNLICVILNLIYFKGELEIYQKINFILAFETHLFFEILCPLYYRGLTLINSFKETAKFFLFSNFISI